MNGTLRSEIPADEARRALALPSDGAVVLVSGGGWGVGDVLGAVDAALQLERVTRVVCLCGYNEALFGRVSSAFAHEPRVRVEGFTDRMPEWMAASDVPFWQVGLAVALIVASIGGLTWLAGRIMPTPPCGSARGCGSWMRSVSNARG
jgi:predicted glycosyltransferase